MLPRPAPSRTFTWTAAIVVFAALSRLSYLMAFRADPFWSRLLHDAWRYHEWASAAAQGRPFEAGAFSQAPLYPWLVGLLYRAVGPSPGSVFVAQSALGVATIVLIARIARRAYGASAGNWAAALAALSGTFVFFETKLLPSALATALAVLLVERLQAADRSRSDLSWIAPGLVLGAAGLTNSALLLAGPPAALWAMVDRASPFGRRARRAAILAAVAALVVLPVTLRNRVVSGEWVLVATNGGITFWQGNNPAARGVYSAPEGFSGSVVTQREEARVEASAEAGRPLTDAEASRHWMGRGLRFLREDLGRAVRLVGAKLALALANREQPLEYDSSIDENPWRLLFPIPYCVVAGLAAARGFVRPRDRRAETPILGVAAVVVATLLAFYVSSRYRLPALALLCAPAGAGAAAIAARARQGVASALPSLAAAVAVTAVSAAIVPAFFADLTRTQTAMALGDRGSALRADGDAEGSIETYRRAIVLDPGYAYLRLDLSRSLRAAGRIADAEAEAREAVRLAPAIAEGWLNLGVILYGTGRLVEAESAFADAWSLDPSDEASGNNLAGTRLRLGNLGGARVVIDDMRARRLGIDPALERALERR